jgi:hypothetical protein
VAVWAVPASEALVPLLVVAGLSQVAALWSVALLMVFTVALVVSPHRMDGRIPCGCFGVRGSIALGSAIARNALLLAVAVFVAIQGANAPAIWLPGSPALDTRSRSRSPWARSRRRRSSRGGRPSGSAAESA